jgi:hypothetical protein
MSDNPAGAAVRDETAPVPPPVTPHPLTRFRPLVVPGFLTVVAVCAVIFYVLPICKLMQTADKNYQKFRRDAVRAQSQPYPLYQAVPPTYFPGR